MAAISPGNSTKALFALFLLAFGTGSSAAVAAERWQKLPTIPYTLNIKQDAISFVDAKTGWYGNGTGRVFRTRDAGSHWRQFWFQSGTYVRALEFIDSKTGFLGNVGPGYFPDVTDPEPLYVTHDGGSTWSPVVLSAGPKVKGVCAIDVLKIGGKVAAIRAGGRVGGPAAMMESFDKGKTWASRDMSAVTGMILDIHFVDEQTGFIAGATNSEEQKAHARILKTSDGGATWRAVFESPRAVDNNWKLAFPSAKVGYAKTEEKVGNR
ncbi:MAG: WD40/YVTN/BNR-like repeat-containing protein [Pseudolabrys sp.]